MSTPGGVHLAVVHVNHDEPALWLVRGLDVGLARRLVRLPTRRAHEVNNALAHEVDHGTSSTF